MLTWTITTDAIKMAQRFAKEASAAPLKVGQITEGTGAVMLNMVKDRSPVITGEYRDSHRLVVKGFGGSVYSAEVFTELPRGQILEFGGDQVYLDGSTAYRHPKPHYRPAFEFSSVRYFNELYKAMNV